MRDLSELVDVDDPVWPSLREEFASSPARVDVLAGEGEQGRACLLQLQVTARSVLGAVVLHTGGVVVDGGWLRIYGGGGGAMPGLATVNRFPGEVDPGWRPPGGFVVGHDVVGGVFVLNGYDPASAGRPGEPGQIAFFAPDSLEWEALGMGYGTWVDWVLAGRLEQFYAGLRWPGWQDEVAGLAPTQGMSVVPFLWSKEAHDDLAATSRRPVPMAELLGLNETFCTQMGLPTPGFLGVV
ncbi:DUF2625 family protein [Actinocrispum wychmicini]|uniref:Uncharacterized protein DUF2625 n=1 Tax=Actinocrispum wychmicini TaxID=1213861 RepID=A0A4R2J0Y6_9PSEU|nr:DUF2625 family protein [Actinocrispum wychmicini]TCO48955.1 uncharacterized protein DUF2625 [Actinocrispum wychmicini]